MTTTPGGSVVEQIRNDFLEMPGLHLTARQAMRLWNLDPATCEQLLGRLVADGFLRQTRQGAFRRDEG